MLIVIVMMMKIDLLIPFSLGDLYQKLVTQKGVNFAEGQVRKEKPIIIIINSRFYPLFHLMIFNMIAVLFKSSKSVHVTS